MRLPIPAGTFRAYLFDCDGTVADSMPLHYVAWTTALGEWNCEFPEELFYAWGGKPPIEIVATLNKMRGLDMPASEVAEHKENLYFELLPQLTAVAEVVEHIELQYGKIPFAVVSGGTRDSVTRSLTTLGLIDKFVTILGSDDYAHSKPAPDGYLLAAERLGVEPADCLVFEDTDLGIRSATAAGMASVKVPSPMERRLNGGMEPIASLVRMGSQEEISSKG
jgi:HAD superfamily hydrolase (TIGR01509 family)